MGAARFGFPPILGGHRPHPSGCSLASPSPASGANSTPLGPLAVASFADLCRVAPSKIRAPASSSPLFSSISPLPAVWEGILGPPPAPGVDLPRDFSAVQRQRARGDGCLRSHLERNSGRRLRQDLRGSGRGPSLRLPRSGLRKVRRCFRCGDRDHIRKFCRNGLVCFSCGGIGHSSKVCSLAGEPRRRFMDRSGDISRFATARTFGVPASLPSPPPVTVEGRPPVREVFIEVEDRHINSYSGLESAAIFELLPATSAVPFPSPLLACRFLSRNYPRPRWNEFWDPIPLGPGKFFISFSTRQSLL